MRGPAWLLPLAVFGLGTDPAAAAPLAGTFGFAVDGSLVLSPGRPTAAVDVVVERHCGDRDAVLLDDALLVSVNGSVPPDLVTFEAPSRLDFGRQVCLQEPVQAVGFAIEASLNASRPHGPGLHSVTVDFELEPRMGAVRGGPPTLAVGLELAAGEAPEGKSREAAPPAGAAIASMLLLFAAWRARRR